MKIIALFLLSLLTVGPVSAEQRLSDISLGVSCDTIPEIEKRLGSIGVAVDEATGVSKYAGTYAGKKATMEYHCEEGRLAEFKIIVTSTSRDEAHSFGNEQKMELSERWGEPLHDGLDLGTWRRLLLGFSGADLDYLIGIVVWGRKKDDAMLTVRETGAEQWEVSISRGSSKMEYILNS